MPIGPILLHHMCQGSLTNSAQGLTGYSALVILVAAGALDLRASWECGPSLGREIVFGRKTRFHGAS